MCQAATRYFQICHLTINLHSNAGIEIKSILQMRILGSQTDLVIFPSPDLHFNMQSLFTKPRAFTFYGSVNKNVSVKSNPLNNSIKEKLNFEKKKIQ